MKNALHVPSMSHNLIPPFVMREAGMKVNNMPKMHCEDPDVNDHTLYFKENESENTITVEWSLLLLSM